MHIVLVNKWYPPYSGYGGIAMYNYYLSRSLVQLGHSVSVVATRWSEAAPAYEEVDGIQVYRLMTHHRSWMHRFPFLGRYMRSLLEWVYSFRIAIFLFRLQQHTFLDIVEFAEIGAEGFTYLHFPFHTKVIVRCHTPTVLLRKHHLPGTMPFNTALTEKMEGYCIHHADLLTTPSYDMASEISKIFDVPLGDLFIIPNPLDTDEFMPKNEINLDQKKDEFVILHVGRLERVKGMDILMQVIPVVLNQIAQARFVFIGTAHSDEQIKYWKKRSEEAGSARVTFLGFVEQDELVKWYQRANVVVVPSLNYESFSYTCAQAMSAGVPVIANSIGGIPETLDAGNAGILIPPNDPDALAKAIIQLARDKKLRQRLGTHGAKIAQERFDSTIVAKQMLEVYKNMCTR